jgi:hypothetical protein
VAYCVLFYRQNCRFRVFEADGSEFDFFITFSKKQNIVKTISACTESTYFLLEATE